MKIENRLGAVRAVRLLAAVALSLVAQSASAAYITELNILPTGPDLVDRVVLDWDTNKTSGIVGGADLTNYRIQLFSGAATIFTDDVIVAGTPTLIQGTIARDPVYFDFDLGTNQLREFNQGSDAKGGFTSGVFYAALDGQNLQDDGAVFLMRWNNGSLDFYGPSNTRNLVSQSTRVPEPLTTSLLGFGIAALAAARRRRQ